jgi:hypothetical protein
LSAIMLSTVMLSVVQNVVTLGFVIHNLWKIDKILSKLETVAFHKYTNLNKQTH